MPKTNEALQAGPLLEVKGAERIERGHGAVTHVIESNRLRSLGYYELAPEATVERTRLPLEEKLIQVEGESYVTVFDEMEGPITHHLSHGSVLKILPGEDHTHINQSGHVSWTKWEFDGDATELVNRWRREAMRREVDNDK